MVPNVDRRRLKRSFLVGAMRGNSLFWTAWGMREIGGIINIVQCAEGRTIRRLPQGKVKKVRRASFDAGNGGPGKLPASVAISFNRGDFSPQTAYSAR